ncbi:MAG: RusA family crossover junction endodeoxyribonuclease [Candidatus Brocadiales bacterium]|nr:RusA family crossover junction endodeoxyribonuclease [Candidatus Bathyanammoxibius sp.]
MFSVFIPGPPVAQQRPGVARKKGGKFSHLYEQEASRAYKGTISLIAKTSYVGPPYSGPVVLIIEVRRPIPVKWSKKKKEDALNQLIRPTSKPDLTNYEVLAENALTGIVYHDDAQVVDKFTRKVYAQEPGLRITVRAVGEHENTKKS